VRKPDRLRRYLRSVRQHMWFVVLAFAVAMGAAVASLLLVNPARDAGFRADVTIQNAPSLFDPNNLPKTNDFAAVATSPNALKQTRDALAADGLSIDTDELASMLVAKARPDENSIDFAVKHKDADTALAVARAWSGVSLKLIPEEAPALERLAASPERAQLQQAGAELAKRRSAVSDLGGPALTGQAAGGEFSAIATEYQTKTAAIAAKGVERTNLQSALDSLRAAVQDGAVLSNSQLRLLLAGVLPADAPLEGSLSAQQAVAALELRLRAVDGSLASLRQEAQLLQTALDLLGGDLQRALTEMRAAEDNYQAASRVVQAYDAAAAAIYAEATLVQSPHVNRNGALEWATRIGAAAVIALFVAVLGTMVLSRLRGRDRRSIAAGLAGSVRPDPAPAPTPRQEGPVVLKRRRGKARHPVEAVFAALAAALLAGLLGTFAARQKSRPGGALPRRR
jgi:hypothetical protein